jgi:hypothetical protein
LIGIAATSFLPQAAQAVEGGISAYFLGSRDAFAGVVPAPGYYFSMDTIYLNSSVEGVSLGGVPVLARTDLHLKLLKINQTYVFDTELWGGTPAINMSIPILNVDIGFTGITPPIVGRSINDTTSGVGDISVTGIVGWHRGKQHFSTGMTVYAPTGSYSTATINPATDTYDLLSNGKNVWSFQPYFAATYFDPEAGFEFSGAASLLVSQKNSATDYQTAPALILEGAVKKHIPSGFAFGLSGYYYQQLSDDSGAGADSLRAALSSASLQARVAGLGPIITYSGTTVFGKKATFELKYTKEFAAKRRFEGEVFSATMALTF